MVEIQNISKKYLIESGEVPALKGCSLSFPETGLFFIVGKSGCGKTTLINMIAGLDGYSDGVLTVDGRELSALSPEELDRYRNTEIGIIFQSFNLIAEYTVFDNVILPLKLQNWTEKTGNACQKRVSGILEYVGLKGYEKRKISELSGGEQQRIAIARSLIKDPKIILADEPTGNLDSATGNAVFSLLKSISRKRLVIVVTHDLASAKKYGDTVISISDGTILSVDDVSQEDTFSFSFDICSPSGKPTGHIDGLTSDTLNRKLPEILNDGTGVGTTVTITKVAAEKAPALPDEKTEAFDRLIPEKPQTVPRALSLGDRFRMSMLFLKKKKGRLCLSVLLLSVTVTLLLLGLFLFDYDDRDVTLKYYEQYPPAFFQLYQEKNYVNRFYDSVTNQIKTGKKLYGLENELVPDHQIHRYYEYQTLYGVKNPLPVTATVVDMQSGSSSPYRLSKGNYPGKNDEIVITDYLASVMSAGIGDTVKWQETDYTVCGLIETDYLEVRLTEKLLRNVLDEYLQYDNTFRYSVALVLENTVSEDVGISLSASDFFISSYERYHSSRVDFANSAILLENASIIGSLPEKENEIMVSDRFLSSHEITADPETLIGTKYQFLDLSDDRYNGVYDGIPNLYEYYPDGVIISGVYPILATSCFLDVILDDSVFRKIASDHNRFYACDGFLMEANTDNFRSRLSGIYENGLLIYEPAVQRILYLKETVSQLAPLIIAVLVLLSILTFLSLTSYITNSIKSNEKNLGILKAIGVTRSEITEIFLIEVLLVFSISALLSALITNGFLFGVNYWFQTINAKAFDIITWNHPMAILAYGISFIFSLLSSCVPILRLSRKKPMEIIRSAE